MAYVCLLPGSASIITSATPVAASCQSIETDLYTFATLNQNNTVAIGPEFETEQELIETFNTMTGNSFATLPECVSWGIDNNVLLYYQYEQIT